MSEKHPRYPDLKESIRRKFSRERRSRYLGDASLNYITARLRDSSVPSPRVEVIANGPSGKEIGTFKLSKSGKLESTIENPEA